MIKIYCHESIINVHHLKNYLESSGVVTVLKNESLTSLAGEVPSFECWPQLWVEENKAQQASNLIAELKLQQSAITNAEPWYCKTCNEKIDAEFELCWQCGGLKP
ncbi:DUF2007 domain-containing protein [Thalassomonas sp. M1454]|uniref:putative signal transducing protein n=1 Tax=Thalassomonas sp. M1454 TaxID=2594477 RepID=UPI001180A94D|nr:DUF2007 domain-containing protein [Thalassomonas sp. M1454]TRX56793.1 DUF2007 domain-containing protein [Thalassomonas sp. M1454]